MKYKPIIIIIIIIIKYYTGWTKKNATLGIGWGYYSKKYASTLILIP